MNAEPLLASIARALADTRLEAILIGNAAAALQGAPVTTLDFDFCFRPTAANLRKIEVLARQLDAVLSHPNEPISSITRVERDDMSLQLDFLPDTAFGVKLESLRSRAVRMPIAGHEILVADLRDVADGKRRANRPKDHAALYAIDAAIREKDRSSSPPTTGC